MVEDLQDYNNKVKGLGSTFILFLAVVFVLGPILFQEGIFTNIIIRNITIGIGMFVALLGIFFRFRPSGVSNEYA